VMRNMVSDLSGQKVKKRQSNLLERKCSYFFEQSYMSFFLQIRNNIKVIIFIRLISVI
jgi:hypothetical protein